MAQHKMYWRALTQREKQYERRAFLDLVGPKWYVETKPDEILGCQGGSVDKVIRDQYGIPVCLRVVYQDAAGKERHDYISTDRVDFFEPWDTWVTDVMEYQTEEECNEFMEAMGCVRQGSWSWLDPETGDVYQQ